RNRSTRYVGALSTLQSSQRLSISTDHPSSVARAAAVSSSDALSSSTLQCDRAKTASPGLGVSVRALDRSISAIEAGKRSINPYSSAIRNTSSTVLRSGSVGPEESASNSPGGTSETTSVTCSAGAAATGSRPPFTADRCFLTTFIAAIG